MSSVPDRLTAALADRYGIEREVGQGGMATVYLAQDLKHDRKVALKVLKPELAAVLGAERFVVEIKTTAALQHPHILPLFDSGTAGSRDGVTEFLYYVMPFIDGETLRSKLDRETQLGIEESVQIARDVAGALHYAHEHGVIHRDIKPENILLHDGRPMVADFGIALALSAAAGGRMTETGLSLGTPHYMSPEQATAEKEITARSDVYSLGSVLYEMLAGEPPHMGNSAQQIIMKIVTDTARPVEQLRKSVPPNVAAAVAKSIEKLAADRFESAKAFAEALGNAAFTTIGGGAARAGASSARGGSRRTAVALGAALVLVALVAAWEWLRSAPELPVARLDLSFGALTVDQGTDVAISPDGSMLAITSTVDGGEPAIYLRRIGEPDFQKVLGSDGGIRPSFSPDNQWIVFRKVPENALVKVAVTGGGALTLMAGGTVGLFEAHWGTDDQIVFFGGQGTHTISASGGTPVRWNDAGGRQPFLLPDGSGILHHRDGNVSVLEFATDSSTVLIPQARHATYVETGHLLYIAEDGGLFAVPFDLGRHRVTGSAVRVLDRVAASSIERGYAVSRNGVLIHHDGASTLGGGGGETQFLVVDFAGQEDTLRLPVGRRQEPRFSPNGRAIVFEYTDPSRNGSTDIYTFDLVTGTTTQLTFDKDNDHDEPLWSPDGTRILFTKNNGDADEDLYIKPVDNSGPEELVLSLSGDQNASAWLDDGTIVLGSGGDAGDDILVYSLTDKGEPRAYLEAPWDEGLLAVSPDRTLAAFLSDERGTDEVWLRTWPVAEGKWRVSTGGFASGPRWHPDGRSIYYWKRGTPVDTLFRAQVDRTPGVVVRTPEQVMTRQLNNIYGWDLHPDGTLFIVAVNASTASSGSSASAGATPDRFLVVLNWFTELKAMMGRGNRP